MQEHLQEALADEFPFMRRGLSVYEQKEKDGFVGDLYGAFGLDVGDGWYQLIRDMCGEIVAVYEAKGAAVDLVVDQVKEKYGTLCFYYHHHKDQNTPIHASDGLPVGSSPRLPPGASDLRQKVARIVDKYEEKSAHVCELCGEPGSLREDLDWMLTLCDAHYRARKQ